METFTFEEYQQARITIAAIEAEIWWRQNVEAGRPISRPTNGEAAALSVKEAAKFLAIGKTKFYALIRTGEIRKGFEVGGRPRWLRTDLEQYVAKQSRKGTR